jgi:putative ABC transport system ATP-binding protein
MIRSAVRDTASKSGEPIKPNTPLVRCDGVSVTVGRRETEVLALHDVSLTVHPNEALVLWGRSGSGKSTLLHVLGGLLSPTAGTVRWATTTRGLRPAGVASVFQSPNLLPHLTAFENIAFAWRMAAANDDTRRRAAEAEPVQPLRLLRLVGLEGKAESLPSELSGGEAQRIAVARALAQRPTLLLCDEPTGHLDSDTGGRVLDLIEALRTTFGFALVLATHDAQIAARLPRAVELLDGRILRDEVRP